jgi:hypothetical protein
VIVSREELTEVASGRWDEVTVDREPPAVGATCWLRTGDREPGECRVRVLDSWAIEGGWCVRVELTDEPISVPRKKSPPPESSLQLAREQRAQLFEGDDRPLVFDTEPVCEPGDVYVLAWARARTIYDADSDTVTRVPREPLFWIEVTDPPARRKDGGWSVRFKVEDRRQRLRLLRRFSAIDLAAAEPDITSNPGEACDRLEAEPTDWDDTRLHDIAEARAEYRDLHEQRDREQETRSLTHRLRRARARAAAQGIDDSREVALIGALIADLERRVTAA